MKNSARQRGAARFNRPVAAANRLKTSTEITNSPRMTAQRKQIERAFGVAIQRNKDDEDLHAKQAKPNPSATPIQRADGTPPGQGGLPSGLRQGVETISGMDMSNVQVHSNSSKPAEVNALAFAQGNEIHVAPGQDRHLPHEAWHVVQQRQGRVKPTFRMDNVAINDDANLEREADTMGAKADQLGSRGSSSGD